MELKFTVHGEPKGKGRPRFNTKTGHAITPKDTVIYENLVRMEYLNQCGETKFPDDAMPNGKQCYESYLKENDFTYHGISNKKGSKRPTVDRFAKDHKSGIFFLNVANHCIAVVDGYYYDTWESGSCCLYGYWEKE